MLIYSFLRNDIRSHDGSLLSPQGGGENQQKINNAR